VALGAQLPTQKRPYRRLIHHQMADEPLSSRARLRLGKALPSFS